MSDAPGAASVGGATTQSQSADSAALPHAAQPVYAPRHVFPSHLAQMPDAASANGGTAATHQGNVPPQTLALSQAGYMSPQSHAAAAQQQQHHLLHQAHHNPHHNPHHHILQHQHHHHHIVPQQSHQQQYHQPYQQPYVFYPPHPPPQFAHIPAQHFYPPSAYYYPQSSPSFYYPHVQAPAPPAPTSRPSSRGRGRAARNGGASLSAAAAAAGARRARAEALDASAADAVAQGDDVVVALLVQSWAGSIGGGFGVIFGDSGALGIVTRGVLFRTGGGGFGAVHEALVGLYGECLYGGREVLGEVVRRAVGADVGPDGVEGFVAIVEGLRALKKGLEDLGGAEGATNGEEECDGGGISPREGWLMRPWREALAGLNAGLVGVGVLREGVVDIGSGGAGEGDDTGGQFLREVRALVVDAIEEDIQARSKVLREELWGRLSLEAGGQIYGAVGRRARRRLEALEKSKARVDADFRALGVSIAKGGCLAEGKQGEMLAVVRTLEALVDEHVDALDKAEAASGQLGVLLTSMRASGVASVAAGVVPPNKALQEFYVTITSAFAALDELRAWSLAGVSGKVMAVLQKSTAPKKKSIRFVEPEGMELAVQSGSGVRAETVASFVGDTVGSGIEIDSPGAMSPGGPLTPSGSGKRHKPRHARMKSSPDELLLFNARLDASDEDGDLFGMEQEFRQVAVGLGPMNNGPGSSTTGGMSVPPLSAGPPPPNRLPKPTTPHPGANSDMGFPPTTTSPPQSPDCSVVPSIAVTPSTPVATSVPSPVRAVAANVSSSDDGDDGGMVVHEDDDIHEDGEDENIEPTAQSLVEDPAVGPVGEMPGPYSVGNVTQLVLDGREQSPKEEEADDALSSTSNRSEGDDDYVAPLPKHSTGSPVSGSTSRPSQSSPASSHMRSMSVDYLRY